MLHLYNTLNVPSLRKVEKTNPAENREKDDNLLSNLEDSIVAEQDATTETLASGVLKLLL